MPSKERAEDAEKEEDVMDRFIHTKIDALEVEKRSDTMRVHFSSFRFPSWLLCMCTFRADIKRTLRKVLGLYLDTLADEMLSMADTLSPSTGCESGSEEGSYGARGGGAPRMMAGWRSASGIRQRLHVR